MVYTDSMYDNAKYLEALLTEASVDLGIADVFYGDQERIPRTPAVCIETGEKRRELNGAPRRTKVTITNYLLVYHNPLKTMEEVREDNDRLTEAIEDLIHTEPQMRDESGEDTVIHSMVTTIENGYQTKANTMFRASRLTIDSEVQVQLPSTP